MFGFLSSGFIGQWGPKISCTQPQTLPNSRIPDTSGDNWTIEKYVQIVRFIFLGILGLCIKDQSFHKIGYIRIALCTGESFVRFTVSLRGRRPRVWAAVTCTRRTSRSSPPEPEKKHALLAESGNVIEVGIFPLSNVAFLSSLWTKWAEIWYTFNLT